MKCKNMLLSALLLATGLWARPVMAEEPASPKPEDAVRIVISGDAYYTRYNLDRSRDEECGDERKGYYLMLMPVEVSWKHYIREGFYVSPYTMFSVTHDFGDESWNKSYWNNNQIVSLGLRLGSEQDFTDESGMYTGGVYGALFAEYQFLTDSFDGSKDSVPDDISSGNFKTGASVWLAHSSDVGRGVRFWKEMWGELAYHSTYFNDEDEDNYLIATLLPKIGLGFDMGKVALEPYLKVSLVNDFLGKDWNEEPWINYVQYGPGVRLSLSELLPGSFYVYAEYFRVDYLDESSDVSEDVRYGLAFWVPIL